MANPCGAALTTVDFDDATIGGLYVPVSADRYRSAGIVFGSDPLLDNMNYEASWWPSVAVALGATLPNALNVQFSSVEIRFVVPGTSVPATTDRFGALFMDSEPGSLLCTIQAFDLSGNLIDSVSRYTPSSMGEVVELAAAGMARVVVTTDDDGADVDNLFFNQPVSVAIPERSGCTILEGAVLMGLAFAAQRTRCGARHKLLPA